MARQARSLQQGDGPKLTTVRIAKTAFAAFKVPAISAAKNLKGFDRLVAGEDGVEFIPVNNPLAVFSGGSMTLELRQKGETHGRPGGHLGSPHRRVRLGPRAHNG